MTKRVGWWAPPLAYAALIFSLSAQSSFPVPAEVWSFDKVIHFIEYGGFAFLLMRAFLGSGFSTGKAAIFSLLTAAAYGVCDEVHQAFVPGRSSSPFDALADAAGASLLAGAWYAKRNFNKTQSVSTP